MLPVPGFPGPVGVRWHCGGYDMSLLPHMGKKQPDLNNALDIKEK